MCIYVLLFFLHNTMIGCAKDKFQMSSSGHPIDLQIPTPAYMSVPPTSPDVLHQPSARGGHVPRAAHHNFP